MDKKTLYIAIGILAGVLLISVFAFFMAFSPFSDKIVSYDMKKMPCIGKGMRHMQSLLILQSACKA